MLPFGPIRQREMEQNVLVVLSGVWRFLAEAFRRIMSFGFCPQFTLEPVARKVEAGGVLSRVVQDQFRWKGAI